MNIGVSYSDLTLSETYQPWRAPIDWQGADSPQHISQAVGRAASAQDNTLAVRQVSQRSSDQAPQRADRSGSGVQRQRPGPTNIDRSGA